MIVGASASVLFLRHKIQKMAATMEELIKDAVSSAYQ